MSSDIVPSDNNPPNVQLKESSSYNIDTAPDIHERPGGNTDVHMGSGSECGDKQVGNDMITDHAMSVDETQKNGDTHNVETSTGPGPNTTEDCPADPGCEVEQDKRWVLLAVAILRQRGKGKVWEEILNTWILLQRSWERVEVRLIHDDSVYIPEKPLSPRPIAEAN